jgi:hypothetical protein
MRVERADVSAVKNRMDELKRSIASKAANALLPKTAAIEAYDSRLQADMLEKEEIKKKLKREAEERKKEKLAVEALEQAEVAGEADDEFQAMMGFGGFGSSKNKK